MFKKQHVTQCRSVVHCLFQKKKIYDTEEYDLIRNLGCSGSGINSLLALIVLWDLLTMQNKQ